MLDKLGITQTMTSEIRGLDKLLRKLNNLASLRAAKRGLKAAALHIKGKIAKYPPSTEANIPMQPRWYERGYGSKWMTAKGLVHGSKTSETLGRRWTISERNAGLTQIVGNNVSYGPYVQDRDLQAKIHELNNWPTVQDVTEDESDTVLKFVKAEVDKELES